MRPASTLAALALALAPAVPSAAAEPAGAPATKALTVGPLEGAAAPRLSGWIEQALGSQVGLRTPDDWAAAAERLGVDPETPDGRAAVSAELGVVGRLRGSLERRRGRWRVKLTLETFDPPATETFEYASRSRRRVGRAVRRGLWRKLEDELAVARVLEPPPPPPAPPPPPPPPPPAPMKVEAPPAPAPAAPVGRAGAAMEAELGFTWGGRRFSYSDPLIGELRPYSSDGVPTLTGRVTVFPGAFDRGGPLTPHLGVDLAFAAGVGLASELEGTGEALGTTAYRIEAGLVGRVPLGDHRLDLRLAYAREAFEVGDGALVPSARYEGVRGGVEGRLALTRDLWLAPALGYRFLAGLGALGSAAWFPNATGGGFDVGLGLGWRLFWQVELRAQVGYRHYFFAFDPKVGDPRVAGGALDRYLDATLGFAVFLD